MKKLYFIVPVFVVLMAFAIVARADFKNDILKTSQGDLEITFLGHGSLMFGFKDKIIHVDPFGHVADYSKLPKADLILVTHHHRDHLDPKALESVRTSKTIVVITEDCTEQVKGGIIMKNGDVKTIGGLRVEAIPAYNLVHMHSEGVPYHPKGIGNGYVITFGDKRVYVAGDTENTPEMKALQNIDCAFLPMNLPYTMTPKMVADAAKTFKPGVLYPYHYDFGETDTAKLVKLMQETSEIDTRIWKTK
ncbi:MAG: MBL fold metallo-hydrolase [Deltaproteobacteria bacterium]|jgi:L-ascorbate metabolism protein UlaG (beta-lactamase superfamily)|nr:MBL fold metallo-hydrolase [Deltaproteobacteria bacterium]